MRKSLLIASGLLIAGLTACEADDDIAIIDNQSTAVGSDKSAPAAPAPLTVQDAKEFIEFAESSLLEAKEYKNRADWVKANFITQDTSWLAAKANTDYARHVSSLAAKARDFSDLDLPADMTRKLGMLKRENDFPTPQTSGAAEEFSALTTELENIYSQARFKHDDKTLTLNDAANILARSRNPEELAAVWAGWRSIFAKTQDRYARMIDITNQGARELGFADTGELWRSGYDMPPEDFAKEAERLWQQVKPLYNELHCHARAELSTVYGEEIVPLDQPIRADLLGNMWAQNWSNIYDIVARDIDKTSDTGEDAELESSKDEKEEPASPAPLKDTEAVSNKQANDLTYLLHKNDFNVEDMVSTAEGFFESLGFEPLPETFWTRSLFVRPADREVTCHPSAWDITNAGDLRIKMCGNVTARDFKIIHHELGHSFYQKAYTNQSIIYRTGANDGFHEAIGDMIALSVTPEYYARIDLVERGEIDADASGLPLLMHNALERVAFIPFGMMVDQWRWKVFEGAHSPSEYNQAWWELRETYQGIRPPSERSETDFDPGAKYHIFGNVPYTRYFLANILQYQFHKAACDIAAHEGPLHKCSIYGNKEVGRRLNAMLEAGASKPWQDTLEAFTGSRDMDASAMLEYYAPLTNHLKEQNKNRNCGW